MRRRIQQFLDETDANPLPTGTTARSPRRLALTGIFLPLYLKSLWTGLDLGAEAGDRGPRRRAAARLSDYYSSRGPDGYKDNSMNALYAVNCLDHDDYVPTKDVQASFAEFEKAAPTFGRAFAYSTTTCSQWPVQSGEHTEAIHAKGAPPIVVVGTTRDPATPLAWAQALAVSSTPATLITRDGDGHTGFQQGNSCVDQAVERWLVAGTEPKPDLKC